MKIIKNKYNDVFYLYKKYKNKLGVKNYLRPIYGLFDDILEFCEEEKTILDFGCGAGPLSFIIEKNKKPTKIYSYDINENYIITAINANNKATKINFSTNLINESNIIQVVIIADVLHHITPFNNKIDILNKIFFLNPDVIIIKDLNPNNVISCYFNNFTDYISTKSKVEYIGIDTIKNIIPDNYVIKKIKYKGFFLWSNYIIKICKI